MSENPRDIHFTGFAKRLWDALPDAPENLHDVRVYDAWSDECENIIACYVYDIVGHALDHAFTHSIVFGTREECTDQIPDPTTQEEDTE